MSSRRLAIERILLMSDATRLRSDVQYLTNSQRQLTTFPSIVTHNLPASVCRLAHHQRTADQATVATSIVHEKLAYSFDIND